MTVAGLNVAFRNVPESAITRVLIDGVDVCGFDPESEAFVQFLDGKQVQVAPHLPARQDLALREALVEHSADRRRALAQGRTKPFAL